MAQLTAARAYPRPIVTLDRSLMERSDAERRTTRLLDLTGRSLAGTPIHEPVRLNHVSGNPVVAEGITNPPSSAPLARASA